jgi:hypothetical protein
LAPSTPGNYTTEYVLSGSATLCLMDVTITVK